jgi:hypothetical protein
MKNHIPTLKKILRKAHISHMLYIAVEDTIFALQTKNLYQAYQLTVVKSFITGRLEPKNKEHAFQEDQEYNQTQFKEGQNVYCLLDNIHHDIAWQLGQMPSGMMVMSVGPKGTSVQEMKPAGTHPVMKRIKLEQNRIHKQFANRRS